MLIKKPNLKDKYKRLTNQELEQEIDKLKKVEINKNKKK